MLARISSYTIVLCLGVALAPGAAAQSDQPISPAENLLFLTNHLGDLTPGTVLSYTYTKKGTLEPSRDDKVRVQLVANGPNAAPNVHVEFLSGEQKFELPDVASADGNPVILFFLERDVQQMQRMTGGRAAYFRKRVRMALASAAEVSDVRLDYAGRSVPGKQIVVHPYRGDPLHARFEQLTDKAYVFTLSDQVPGGVYRLQTSARPPRAADDTPVLIEETVTLTQVKP